MEYIITRTVEFRFTVEADSKEQALINVAEIPYEEAEQLTAMQTTIESIDEYEASFAPRMFIIEHPKDRFFIDDKQVSVDKLNDYFDSHDVGWSTEENDNGGTDTIILRE
jgi:hypothetical protein